MERLACAVDLAPLEFGLAPVRKKRGASLARPFRNLSRRFLPALGLAENLVSQVRGHRHAE